MTEQQLTTPKRNLTPFWILLAISGLPYLLSWVWYANMDSLPELAAANRGELIDPVRPVEGLLLQTITGKSIETSSLKGNWTLLTAGSSDCDESCMNNVYYMRQIRRLMGEDRLKIRRIFVMTDDTKVDEFLKKVEPFGEMDVVSSALADGSKLIEQMTVSGNMPEKRIFIVDPLANLMMAYNQGTDPEDIAKDFRRLLKVVRIGDPKDAG